MQMYVNVMWEKHLKKALVEVLHVVYHQGKPGEHVQVGTYRVCVHCKSDSTNFDNQHHKCEGEEFMILRCSSFKYLPG